MNKTLIKPHIFLATPMYGGNCSGRYTQSVIQLEIETFIAGYDFSYHFMFNESLIQRSRNQLVKRFLESKATHLLFIDSDVSFNAKHVIQMVQEDKDIICGLYPKKHIYWDKILDIPNNEYTLDMIKTRSLEYAFDGLPNQTIKGNDLVEVKYCGAGYMLIKREVFEMVKDVETYIDFLEGIGHTPIKNYFKADIDETSTYFIGEDYYFCKKWNEIGGKIYAAPYALGNHFGGFNFGE